MKQFGGRTPRRRPQTWQRGSRYLACGLSVLLLVIGCAGEEPGADHAGRGESSSSSSWAGPDTRALTERFRQTLVAIQEREGFPGGIAAFALPSGRVGVVSAGYSDVEAGTLMPPHARLQSGSIGKTFVAAVGLSLALEGSLDLDAPISRYVGDRPWFSRLPNAESITVRQLMTHSSGLPDHVYDPDFAARLLELGQADPLATLSPEELVAFVHDDEPLFAPGQGYAYSDTGYIVLGLVIEAVSEAPYYALLRERFLDPLKLEFTVPSAPRVDYQAPGYMAEDNPFALPTKTLRDGVMVFNPEIEWTGGGLSTNPADLVRWAKLLYEGEAIPGEYLDELLGSGVPMEEGGEDLYGLGVYILDTPFGRSYGHGGWFPGYRSQLRYYPDHRIAIALQTNTDVDVDLNQYVRELTEVLLQELD